ncbi:MAG: hypothetical protein JHC84_00400 [Solirubrobacteraceae bacterium]|nr:hypothetical protein [Solirubrobacteraceae bacterium]
MTSRNLFRAAALAVTAGLLLAAPGAGTAAAGSQTVNNACQYSYDSYWRDMDVTMTGTPSAATAQPGDTIRLSGQVFDVTLPDWLAEYGYNFGLLQAGENQLPTDVWVAVRGTNTVEGVQWQKVETVATTTITVTSTGSFDDATEFTYNAPQLSDTDWTAKGGPIAFSQARADSLPPLPVASGGANRAVRGSVFLHVDLGGIFLGLDCSAGGFIADGSNFTERIAPPFATVDVPAFSCINPLTPQGTSSVPVRLELLPDPADPATVRPGGSLTTSPRVRYRIPTGYLQALAAAGRLQPGETTLTGTLRVGLRALGATPAGQIATAPLEGDVRIVVDSGGQVTVFTTTAAGTVESDDVSGTAVLSPTTWTASGTSGLQLAAGAVGALGAVPLGGGTDATAYGSAYARLELTPETGPATRLSLDCASGEVDVAQPGIAYGERGNVAPAAGGDQGRYAIEANDLDPFTTIPVEGVVVTPPPVDPGPTPDPGPAPLPAPPVVLPGSPPPPSGQGGPAPPARPLLAIESTALRATSNRVRVTVRCTGGGTCTGQLKLRTAGKVRLTKRAKARQLTLSQTLRYRVASGRTTTVTVRLSRTGTTLLRRSSRVRAQVVATPSGKKGVTRTLTLRRTR